MLYFSELLNKKVITEKQQELGTLTDVLFLYEEEPKVVKIVVKTSHPSHLNVPSLTIPITNLVKLNTHIIVHEDYESLPPIEQEMSVSEYLLDKQIIDLVGNEMLRVNDVVIQDSPYYYISGVEIGALGILRRLGVEKQFTKALQFININLSPQLLSWGDIQNIELGQGVIQLKQREEKISKLHAEDLANYLEKTNIKNAAKLLKVLDKKKSADIIENLNITYQDELFHALKPDRAASFIDVMEPDDAVDILLTFSQEKRNDILELVTPRQQKKLKHLLGLSKTPVGHALTSEFVTVLSDATVQDVFKTLRDETNEFSRLSTLYVVNEKQQLVGVFNLHELILQKPDTPVYKFMIQDPIVIHLTTPIEIVINKLFKYKLAALPVLDKNKEILGIVTMDDMGDFVLKKNT
ncbi:magnesium transporter [Candidatus Roizmanbacteria bacterium]|nr:magnesium transporter [Candidatus Roizmanbacteria bacterium]